MEFPLTLSQLGKLRMEKEQERMLEKSAIGHTAWMQLLQVYVLTVRPFVLYLFPTLA
jgi:hypothetical protein